jgi:hypothetical protein
MLKHLVHRYPGGPQIILAILQALRKYSDES